MMILALAGVLLAQNPAMCSGADPAITSVSVANMTTEGGINVYHLTGTVENRGSMKQPSNLLEFVDIYFNGSKIDSRGIPPLAPGQHYTFGYDYRRSAEAGQGTSALQFKLDFRQPAPSQSQDCNAGNDEATVRL